MSQEIKLPVESYLELLRQVSEINLNTGEKNSVLPAFNILDASIDMTKGLDYNVGCISNFLSFLSVKHLIIFWNRPKELPFILKEAVSSRPVGNLKEPEIMDIQIFSGNSFKTEKYTLYPIKVDNRIIGVLVYDISTIPVGIEPLIKLISRIAVQSGVIFERAEFALNTTQSMLYTCPLMKIRNRNCLDVEQDSYHPIHVAFIDIDKFKSINDSYGHNFGDFILSEVGKILNSITNRNTTPYRFGGDEVVVLSDDSEKLTEFLNKLKEITKDMLFSNEGFETKITFSIGVSLNAKTVELGRAWADYAMYEIKKNSKNSMKILEAKDYFPDIESIKKEVGEDR